MADTADAVGVSIRTVHRILSPSGGESARKRENWKTHLNKSTLVIRVMMTLSLTRIQIDN